MVSHQIATPSMVTSLQHIRRMHGGAQAHLVRCSDGYFYIVKFRNNPQHSRILVNEMLATRLADAVGLPVPRTAIVEVDQSFLDHSPGLRIQLQHGSIPVEVGLHFGSQFVVDPCQGRVLDYMAADQLHTVRNLQHFFGALAVDKWFCNADRRQVAFWRWSSERKYRASFIDQGFCFNAEKWTFPDFVLRGAYSHNEVYAGVCGWDSFEPWLSRIESMPEDVFWRITEQIPPAWYQDAWKELKDMVLTLIERRQTVRDLIQAFRSSSRQPFPNWA